MRHIVILVFSCLFVLFLATTAQASEFTGNTCYDEGANCQTQADWLVGWCEAAFAAGAIDQTVEACAQSVGANQSNNQVVPTQSQTTAQASEFTGNTCHEEGANCQTQADWMIGWCEAVSAAGVVEQSVEECTQSIGANHPDMQVVPAQSQNTRSSASDSGQSGSRKHSTDRSSGDSGTQRLQRNADDVSNAERAQLPDQKSSNTVTQNEQCQSYRVIRNDPTRRICVRPLTESVPDTKGTNFDPFDTTPIATGT